MKKQQLIEEIKELKEKEMFNLDIIQKLLNNYIEIKPMPKGKIKDRIVVFSNPAKFTKDLHLYGTALILLKPKTEILGNLWFKLPETK